jgi:diadenosine tetraphosphate (Ap4A) HIT family hydrolase/8-oxo-dGTP pyrophosphatase MutT (NUDIX family)
MTNLTPEEHQKQEIYRDARFTGQYNNIWQSVGKCVFCHLNEKYVFFEENGVVMTISLYAYIDGHFMIVPRRHVRSPRDLSQAEWDTVRKFTYIAKKIIKDVHGITGMQVVEKEGSDAQSTVTDHLHFHCIPFDAPDLCQWNYRKLKNTPLENVDLYKHASKKILKYDERFEQKYRWPSSLPIVCDLIIINEKHEILFQERPEWAKRTPDVITIPGGGVDDYAVPLEQELARELREEVGADIDTTKVKLVASRIDAMHSSAPHKRSLWNTYVLRGFDSATPLTPGDDAEHLIWVPFNEIKTHPRISPEIKHAILSLEP